MKIIIEEIEPEKFDIQIDGSDSSSDSEKNLRTLCNAYEALEKRIKEEITDLLVDKITDNDPKTKELLVIDPTFRILFRNMAWASAGAFAAKIRAEENREQRLKDLGF